MLIGCRNPKADQKAEPATRVDEKSQPHPETLWAYLENFRHSADMPTTDEVRKRFGEPNENMEWDENPSYGDPSSTKEYHRYSADEKRLKNLPVVALRYYYMGDTSRWVDVIVRKKESTVVGWMWFENVPQEQETGPPK